MKQVQEEAIRALSSVQKSGHRNVNLDLISMALHGKKINFDKVIKMIDDMVVLLGKEQVADDKKKAYCEAEFDKADDKKKALEWAIEDLEKIIEEDKEMVTTLTGEIKELEEGIVKLDREVVQATEQRKEEHSEFTTTLASNNAAMKLIEMAKNRMNKFYNPKLAKFIQTHKASKPLSLAQSDIARQAPPPPPAAEFGGKKGEESGGVIALMDSMIADLKAEIQEMEFNEKDAQEEYETMVTEAADKRAADTKSVEEKSAAKALLEEEIVKNGDMKASEETELMATKQYIADLHADCDWLIQNFETRKSARANEIDALKKAKAVLSGADYSLVQIGNLRHRV